MKVSSLTPRHKAISLRDISTDISSQIYSHAQALFLPDIHTNALACRHTTYMTGTLLNSGTPFLTEESNGTFVPYCKYVSYK